jgi:aspartate racemase
MKTLGIIGGIAPESTVDYYRSIIALYRERKADGSYPPLLVNSIDLQRMLELIGRRDLSGLTAYLLAEISKLKRAGADWGLLASNTPHIVFEELERQSPLPLLSIVEATCRAAQARALKKVGLFGTRFTMQGGFYSEVFARYGIGVSLPEPGDQEYIHQKYMNELVQGVFREETRERLLAIVDRLAVTEGIEAVILGGTELPLILRDAPGRGIPFLDTTRIHVEEAVERILSEEGA